MMKSVRTRYLHTLVLSGVKGTGTIGCNIILARSLGPESYGIFSYVTVLMLSLKQFTDLSIANGFFTFISEEQKPKQFYLFSLILNILVFLLGIVIIIITNNLKFFELLEINQSTYLLLLAFMATFSQAQVWPLASYIAESMRLTIPSNIIGTLAIFAYIIVITILNEIDFLNLETIFTSLIIIWIIFSCILIFYTLKKGLLISDQNKGSKHYALQFFEYCKPLIPYMMLSAVFIVLDRWMLQIWGGSEDQGYFNFI